MTEVRGETVYEDNSCGEEVYFTNFNGEDLLVIETFTSSECGKASLSLDLEHQEKLYKELKKKFDI